MAPRRGLDDTNKQTFEVVLTPALRKTLNKIFLPNASSVVSHQYFERLVFLLEPLP